MTAPAARRAIVFLSDFGGTDPWVGEVKGRLAGLAAGARVHDLAHDIAPGDVAAGAFHLAGASPAWPAGTILLAVIDPGVGSARRSIAARIGRGDAARFFVGPDNGLLSDFSPGEIEAFQLPPPPRRVGTTFDGRDLFAPAAAALARGKDPSDLGAPVDRIVRLPALAPSAIWYVDRFGNAITNVPPGAARVVEIAGRSYDVRGPVASYADAAPDEAVLLVSSRGTLEIAVSGGSFAARAELGSGGASRGTPIRLRI